MSGQNSLLAISTPLGEDVLTLRKANYQESLGQAFTLNCELISDDEDIVLDDILGKNVTIRLETDEDTRYFNGIVTEFFQKDNLDKNAHYGAVVKPWFWLLTLTENCRIFQDKSYPEIIKEVFNDLGFSDFEDKLSGNFPKQDYVVQFNESDFDFVSRIMQQEGIFYYFKHINGKHTLVMLDDNSTLEDVGEVPFFELEDESKHQGVNGITQWQNHKQIRTGGVSLSSFDFTLPSKDLRAVTADPKTASLSAFEKYHYPGKYSERAAGDNYTKILMEKENAAYEQKRMSGNYRSLYAGATFKFVDYLREDQNTEYVITGYSCIMRADAYMAERKNKDGNEKSMFEFSATAIPAKIPFRPQLDTQKPKMTGPQTATVVGKKGEEIWTDKYGRIKVQFHWDRNSSADEKSSCWIRVSQSLAGKNWGSMYIPRIGQEVLVDFLNGDPDQPIAVGCVYNGSTMPPYPLPANATITGYKSRTSKGGGGFNEIRFEDKKGDERIYVHGQKNQDIRINNSKFETIGNDRHLLVKNDKFESVENNRNEDVAKDHIENIGKDRHITIGGKEAHETQKTFSMKVHEDFSQDLGKNHSMKVAKDSFTKATNVCIEASSNITLKVGGSSIAIEAGGITLKSSGEIKLDAGSNMTIKSGAMTSIKAGAAAEVAASAPLTLKGAVVKIN